MSELIHSSSNHQNLEYARVSVHFHDILDDTVRPHLHARLCPLSLYAAHPLSLLWTHAAG